ncbi:nuclear transport factor 2 family protein [Endozoicomonas atrinae]|uniref:nuclear transport factor 2 family protein n=1 Tax=Endozoicomonas atrinae TaxID=1333660 RepID=UPI0008267C1A|nr:nuclear transport factor 2 family protein [Endozoicomonas atrinae]
MTEQDKILLARGALLEVLGKHDVSKISDFFTEDAVIIINEKKLTGTRDIADRLKWIKSNVQRVDVDIQRVFFSGNQGFDHHTTRILSLDGQSTVFKIFGYIELRDSRICLYEDVTIQIDDGENRMHIATDTMGSSGH